MAGPTRHQTICREAERDTAQGVEGYYARRRSRGQRRSAGPQTSGQGRDMQIHSSSQVKKLLESNREHNLLKCEGIGIRGFQPLKPLNMTTSLKRTTVTGRFDFSRDTKQPELKLK